MTSINDVKQQFYEELGELGKTPSRAIDNRVDEAAATQAEKEYRRYQENNEGQRTQLAKKIKAGFQTVATGLVVFSLVAGSFIATLLILAVETVVVKQGFSVLSPIEWVNWLYSLGLTSGYLLIVTVVVVLSHQEKQDTEQPKRSLRHIANEVFYFIGLGSGWQEQSAGNERMIVAKRAYRLAVFAILGIGLIGRLYEPLQMTEGMVWYRGILHILTQSDLTTFLYTVSTFVFALALIALFHAAMIILYDEFVQYTGGIQRASVATGKSYNDFYVEALQNQVKMELIREQTKQGLLTAENE